MTRKAEGLLRYRLADSGALRLELADEARRTMRYPEAKYWEQTAIITDTLAELARRYVK